MVKKKTSRRKKSAKKQRKKKRSIRKILRFLSLLTVVAAVIYVVYLDYVIRDGFEGDRWQIPARVYARPLELYAGQNISRKELAGELKSLNYKQVSYPKEAGSYWLGDSEVIIVTRSFRFWDGQEPSKRVRIQFNGNDISRIENASTHADESLVRLDPQRVASIYPQHNEDRILLQLQDVPDLLVKGLIEVEDKRFHHHMGVDFLAIASAIGNSVFKGKRIRGASTLTQQLVKNYFLSNARSLSRKINEAVMALLLEVHYEKDDILESYLNEVYLGQDGERSINGFGLASQFYFARSVERLKPHQIALLVALANGPSSLNPRRYPRQATKRRNFVLDIMFDRGLLNKQERDKNKAASLAVVNVQKGGITKYPAFLDLVKRQLRRDYRDDDLSSAGLRIFTTMDPQVQRQAELSLSKSLASFESGYKLPANSLQGSVIVTDVNNAEVLAVVGGRQPRYSGFNRALDAVRSVGSLIKPAVYLAALKSDYTLASLLDDSPIEIEQKDTIWAPQNYDKEFHGDIPLFMSFANSYNVATVRLGLEVGLPEVADVISDLGVHRPFKQYPSTLLGTLSMSPLEVTQMYQTMAASGFYSPLRSIRAVLDAKGKPLNRYPLSVSQVVNPQDSLMINYGLHLVTQIGTAKYLKQLLPDGMKVAGKTGTTDDLRDSWFAGFSQNYLSVVWMGHDDDKPTKFTGSSGAMQVWARLMTAIRSQSLNINPVEGIEMAWIDMQSGKKTSSHCTNSVELPFKSGRVPTETQECTAGVSNWFNRIFR